MDKPVRVKMGIKRSVGMQYINQFLDWNKLSKQHEMVLWQTTIPVYLKPRRPESNGFVVSPTMFHHCCLTGGCGKVIESSPARKQDFQD